jgi:hypothetical protein
MKFQRSLILVFATVLTGGTCAATSVQFTLNMNSGNPWQTVTLSVDGQDMASIYPPGSTFQTASQSFTDGWYSIAITYDNLWGANGLAFSIEGLGWTPLAVLRSLDASGTTINGLTGDYYALDAGTHLPTTHLFTDYGEGPIHYSGGAAGPWSGFTATSTFQETLTGQIYIGSDTNPPLGTINPPQSDPPPSGADAPEPATWWLAAVALPLMLFSRLRLRHPRTRH